MSVHRDPGAAHRIAALAADRDDGEIATVVGDCLGRKADRVRVERPARPRSLVMSTISRFPPSRFARRGCSSPPRTVARSARTSSIFWLYGREESVASWARFSFDAATNCMARVICLMFLTAAIRRRISRWLATQNRPGADHAKEHLGGRPRGLRPATLPARRSGSSSRRAPRGCWAAPSQGSGRTASRIPDRASASGCRPACRSSPRRGSRPASRPAAAGTAAA